MKLMRADNYSGFTLLEMLVSLSIFSMFFLFSGLFFQQWQTTIAGEQFMALFEKQLVFAQQCSIVKNENIMVSFSQGNQVIAFYRQETKEKITKELLIPNEFEVIGPETITFLKETGNNGRLAKYQFLWKEKQKKIEFQFQMGSGKYVKKVSKL